MGLRDELIEVFDNLPIEKQEEVLDFVEYLKNKQNATEYLFSTEANKKHLDQAIANAEAGKELVEISLEDLEKGNLFTKLQMNQ